jgi:hypothetical protein
MDKKQQEIQAILKTLENLSGGASLDDIVTALRDQYNLTPVIRTLQRRLTTLKEEGEITTNGATKGTLYFLAKENASKVAPPTNEGATTLIEAGNPVPLSQAGENLLRTVRIPFTQREAKGYNKKFLDDYIPNKSHYLSEVQLTKLEALGNTNAGNAPAGTYAKQVLGRLLIDLSYNSSRLEGNTYSLLDAEQLLDKGQPAGAKTGAETQMLLNHKDAIEFIVENADDIGMNRYTILNLHALLSNNLLRNPEAQGRLRARAVGIGETAYTPEAVPQLIEEAFHEILQKAGAITNPFEQAFFVMVHLPYLQPFEDVNKRVSRLAANIPLNRHNLVPLSFTDVPGDLYTKGLIAIYEFNRIELFRDVFLWAYERSARKYAEVRQTLGEPDAFRMRYRNEMREFITEVIRGALSKGTASEAINAYSEKIPAADRQQFIETTQTELLGLHEGNFARFRVRPAEFKRWKEVWDDQPY